MAKVTNLSEVRERETAIKEYQDCLEKIYKRRLTADEEAAFRELSTESQEYVRMFADEEAAFIAKTGRLPWASEEELKIHWERFLEINSEYWRNKREKL